MFDAEAVGVLGEDQSVVKIEPLQNNLYYLLSDCFVNSSFFQLSKVESDSAIALLQSENESDVQQGLYLLHIGYGHVNVKHILKTLEEGGISIQVDTKALNAFDLQYMQG